MDEDLEYWDAQWWQDAIGWANGVKPAGGRLMVYSTPKGSGLLEFAQRRRPAAVGGDRYLLAWPIRLRAGCGHDNTRRAR